MVSTTGSFSLFSPVPFVSFQREFWAGFRIDCTLLALQKFRRESIGKTVILSPKKRHPGLRGTGGSRFHVTLTGYALLPPCSGLIGWQYFSARKFLGMWPIARMG